VEGGFVAVTLATLGMGVASALVPVLNIEAYLLALAAARGGSGAAWWFALVATVGQMGGKVLFYYAGRGALGLPALSRRKASSRRFNLAALRERLVDRPYLSAGVVFASATVGVPPFAVVSLLAGMIGMPLRWFLVVGSIGRFLRFMTVLLVPGMLGAHIGW
jgi:membrane protein YqaA with SNARE-associated domain